MLDDVCPQLYLADQDRLSPLGGDLSDFPSTLCIGAECDVLLDDALALYGQLASAQVDVSLSLWPGLPHGCLHYVGVVESVTNAARSIVKFIGAPRPAPHAVADAVAGVPTTSTPRAGGKDEGASPSFSSNPSRLGLLTNRIAAAIVGGELAEGLLLPTEEIASRKLDVSRSAYREAMRTLAAKGLLESTPKIGTRIAPRRDWHLLDPDVLAWHFEFDG